MNNKLVELLKSETAINFYIKYSICYIGGACFRQKKDVFARSIGYYNKGRSFKSHVEGIVLDLMLFVPYVGWFMTALMGMCFFINKFDEKDIIYSERYAKIEGDENEN